MIFIQEVLVIIIIENQNISIITKSKTSSGAVLRLKSADIGKITKIKILEEEVVYKLVEKVTERIDVTKRQTLEVAEFKKIPGLKHNEVFEGKSLNKGKK